MQVECNYRLAAVETMVTGNIHTVMNESVQLARHVANQILVDVG